MAKTRKQKEKDLTLIVEKLNRSKAVIFADYQGLSMNQLSDLRDKLREQQAELSVTKNSLVDLALKEVKLSPTDDIKSGPTATLYSFEDEVLPLKALVKALKEAQKGKVKGGFLGSEFLDSVSLMRLASLPGKQELQGKVVGLLASPLSGIVNVLQGNIRNLVYALDQIKQKRG